MFRNNFLNKDNTLDFGKILLKFQENEMVQIRLSLSSKISLTQRRRERGEEKRNKTLHVSASPRLRVRMGSMLNCLRDDHIRDRQKILERRSGSRKG